jgi:hypothetical protein
MECFFQGKIHIGGSVANLDNEGTKVKSKPYSFIISIRKLVILCHLSFWLKLIDRISQY